MNPDTGSLAMQDFSFWLSLKMIDGLIFELDRLNICPHICDLRVPCVILADGTSLISNTQTTMQTQLNVAVDYAFKWRLKYNSLKSCIIYFTSKYNRKNNCYWEHLSLRDKRCSYRYHRQKHLRQDSNKLSITCKIAISCSWSKGRKIINVIYKHRIAETCRM